MKRIFLFLIGTFLGCAGSPLSAQEIKPRGQHPRLFFTPERIAKLKERIKTEPTTANAMLEPAGGRKINRGTQSGLPHDRGEAVCRKGAERHGRPELG